jgi:ubiquitin-protein ligase
MASRQRRLITDYVNARKDGASCGFDIRMINPDDYEHYYILFTPLNGVYKGQQYVIQLDTVWNEERYPICRPKVKFLNNCWHVNVGSAGGVCVTFLNDAAQWVPSYTFTSIMQSIAVLFDEPNPASPMNGEAGKLWTQCTSTYKSMHPEYLPMEQVNKIYSDCYAPFIQKAAQSCGPVKEFIKWFPQLDKLYYEKNILAISAEEAEFKELANSIIKKKPSQPTDPSQPSQPSNPPATQSASEPANTPDNTSAKAPRWAKYQTKK